MRRPLSIALTLLLPIASVLATLAAFEAVLAFAAPVPFSIERNMYFVPDPDTGYRIAPGSLGYFQGGIAAAANRYGHRDDPVDLDKPPGTLRVLAVGDSFTVGASVEQEEAYPQVLEELLRESLDAPVEVVNTGVGGWSPFQYAQYFEREGLRFGPDLVLVGLYVGNDAYDQHRSVEQLPTAVRGRRVERGQAALPTSAKVWLYEHFHLARLLLNRGPVARDVTREDCEDFSDQYLDIQGRRLRSHRRRSPRRVSAVRNSVHQISRIHSLAARKSIPVLVVLLPTEMQVNPALQGRLLERDAYRWLGELVGGPLAFYDFAMPQSLLVERFAARDIPTVDLLPAFAAHERCLYLNDTHWTPEGHRLAASVVLPRVAELLTR